MRLDPKAHLALRVEHKPSAPDRARAFSGGPSEPTWYFFDSLQAATCSAICARVVPSVNPFTCAPAPGATEAHAAVFVDRFLASFALPIAVADNPAVYLRGRFSNRNAYPDPATGEPSRTFPADAFLDPSGQAHFVDLDALQELSWRWLVEGRQKALAAAPAALTSSNGFRSWLANVDAGLVPAPPADGLQGIYTSGLASFDTYSKQLFGVPFAQATAQDQDLMLEAAGAPGLSDVPLASPPGAPAPAKTLFGYVVVHTFEGCYGLPEYRWLDANPLWAEIAWDGDTQPLGNSVYDENLYGPGEGTNAGFGEPGIYVPRGGYKEHRPVSTVGEASGNAPVIDEAGIAWVINGLRALGVLAVPAANSRMPSGTTR